LPRSASSASEPGASSSAAPSPEEGDPPPGTYATLPLDTVDERTVTLAASNGDPSDPSFGPQTSGAGAEAVLTPGPEGTYTLHRIVFPGYEEALEGVSVTIREANLFERYGFPQQSGAIFTLEAEGDDFTLPVALDVEFRTDPTDGDVVTLEGDPGDVTKMRLLRRLDIGAPLEFVTGIEQGVSSPTVWTFGATPLTQQGLGVYGVVVNPDETGPTSGLVFR
jgi:hypothetical protein